MRPSFQAIGLVILCVVVGCTAPTPVKSPPSWTIVNADEFEFSAPPDFKAVPVHGIDSFVGEYRGDTITLVFDYGPYSDPLDYQGRPAYTSHTERIGGKVAKIVSYYNPVSGHHFDYAIGVYFPDLNGKGTRLTVYATCKTTHDYETARTIFRTIRFKRQ
jgi:hypothetical protein